MNEIEIQEYVYEKEYICPVCESSFKDYVVKGSKLKFISSDIDLKPNYEHINPLFYDVILCQHCGYATPRIFFGKLVAKAADNVLKQIKPHFKPRNYPKAIMVEEAIERNKLALLSSVVKGAPNSEQGYICMKLAWLYRTAEDTENEQEFLEKTIKQFNQAYINEEFPLCELDVETFSYMLAAFYKLTGKPQEGLKWLSNVLVSKTVNDRLKDRAFELKNQIQAELK